MDNALIDDRRIHVDFSQSVSKLWKDYVTRDNKTGKGEILNSNRSLDVIDSVVDFGFSFIPGKGCFKCGAPDHFAKDCTGEQPAKFILKDADGQHGGYSNSKSVNK